MKQRYCSLLLLIIWSLLILSENIKKLEVFWHFQGYIKRDQWHETWNGCNMKSDDYNPIISKLTEAVGLRCCVKNVFLEISQNPQKNTCARVSFLIKLQTWGNFIIKRGFGTGVFLWSLGNIYEHFFIGHIPWLLFEFSFG